jgi:Hg(II)-responsive transcriptional regulator
MLTIGKAASAANLSIDTVRFYERSGLLKSPPRTAAGYRLYRHEDVDRLRFIHRAKALGFSLEEIGQLLRLNDGTGRRRDVKVVAARRLAELEQKLAELSRIRHALAHLVHTCDAEGPLDGCPIIEALIGSDVSTTSSTPARKRRSANKTNED